MECVICLEPLIKTGEELVTVRCGHLFHNSCLVKTLANALACPICRKVTIKEHIIKIFINNDVALGKCQDCAKNKKELEESLERTNTMVKEQSQLFDKEQHALNRARYYEWVYKDATEKTKKIVAEKDTLVGKVENHKYEKQILEATIASLKEELEKEKQKRRVLQQENRSLQPKVVKKPEPEPAENTVTKEREKKVDHQKKMVTPPNKSAMNSADVADTPVSRPNKKAKKKRIICK